MINSFFASKNMLIDGDRLWLLTKDTNVLCEFIFPELRLNSYYILPNETVSQYACLSFVKVGKYIYVLPYNKEDLFIVNTESSKIKQVKIPYCDAAEGKHGKFSIVGCFREKLAMIGYSVKGIFFFDGNHFQVKCEYIDILKTEGVHFDQADPPFSDSYLQFENKIYAPLFRKNLVLVVDIESENCEILRINDDVKLRTIDIIDEKDRVFFFTTVEDERIIWSPKQGIIEKRKLNALEGSNKWYIRAYGLNDKYYYIGGCERKVFVETDRGMTQLAYHYPMEGALPEGYIQFEGIFKKDDCIFFQTRSDGSIFGIDTNKDVIKRLNFDISNDQMSMLVQGAYKGKVLEKPLYEEVNTHFKDFINLI